MCETRLETLPMHINLMESSESHTENVLLPLLTDMFHLLLSDGVTPHLWHKVKITPLHKKGPITSPQNYRLLAINGCIYRLFANVVRDLLMDWALAEHQIPDSQFGFCPTRNTNQPLFILLLQKRKKWCSLLFWTFLLPTTVFQERNFGDTCKKLRLHNI